MSSWIGRLNIIKMSTPSQINRFNFCKTNNVTIKTYMKVQSQEQQSGKGMQIKTVALVQEYVKQANRKNIRAQKKTHVYMVT